ncbi:MAG: hypothetical protein IPK79_06210 [Vampirovibrionales bacterium]|nr:hypothetical protein [Vampirovibrionales bacterium]
MIASVARFGVSPLDDVSVPNAVQQKARTLRALYYASQESLPLRAASDDGSKQVCLVQTESGFELEATGFRRSPMTVRLTSNFVPIAHPACLLMRNDIFVKAADLLIAAASQSSKTSDADKWDRHPQFLNRD